VFNSTLGLKFLQAGQACSIVKTGKINTTNNTHFLYENLQELSWAVIDLSFDEGLEDIDIFKVSHISTFTGANPVPEPSTMVLFGIGLLGIAGLGKKHTKNNIHNMLSKTKRASNSRRTLSKSAKTIFSTS